MAHVSRVRDTPSQRMLFGYVIIIGKRSPLYSEQSYVWYMWLVFRPFPYLHIIWKQFRVEPTIRWGNDYHIGTHSLHLRSNNLQNDVNEFDIRKYVCCCPHSNIKSITPAIHRKQKIEDAGAAREHPTTIFGTSCGYPDNRPAQADA